MRIILIEDNPQVRELLHSQLPVHWPGAVVVGETDSIAEGYDLLSKQPADLWLLDIELRDGNVFTLLDRLDPLLLERTPMVFLTAFNTPEFILEAFRKSAMGYLLKPVDLGVLRPVLEKVQTRLAQRDLHEQLDELRMLILESAAPKAPPSQSDTIPIYRTNRVITYIPLSEIAYFEGEGSTSKVHFLENRRPLLNSVKNLGFYDNALEKQGGFFRVAKHILVNLSHVEGLGPKNTVWLKGGNSFTASRDGAKSLKRRLKRIYGDEPL